jgi:hypothetical protein
MKTVFTVHTSPIPDRQKGQLMEYLYKILIENKNAGAVSEQNKTNKISNNLLKGESI